MRILLVGEYSNLHNSLQKGLQELNHEVLLIRIGDGFKKYKSDILIKTPFKSGFLKKVNSLFVKIFKLDLHSIYTFLIIKKYKDDLKGYDIVQYINESPFLCTPDFEIKIFNFLKKQNKKSFLLSCGTDYTSVKYAYDKRFKYSILTPFFENKISEEQFFPILKYLTPSYKKLHEHLLKNIEGVIASDLDYHLPLLNHPKYLVLIPNPVNISNFDYNRILIKYQNRNNFF